jgi:hypothetical protein
VKVAQSRKPSGTNVKKASTAITPVSTAALPPSAPESRLRPEGAGTGGAVGVVAVIAENSSGLWSPLQLCCFWLGFRGLGHSSITSWPDCDTIDS